MSRKNQRKGEPGRGFKRFSQLVFAGTLLYNLSRLGCSAGDHIRYISSLKGNGQQQEMVERGLADRSELEKQLEQQGKPELDSSKSIADFLKEGQSPSDLGNYMDHLKRDHDSGRTPEKMDATSLLLTAKEFRFRIDPPKQDPGINPTADKGPEKYLDPDAAQEKGHHFELHKADGNDILAYTRDTSHIVPRGQFNYGKPSPQKTPEKRLEVAKDNKAIVMVDTSGSMCSNKNNYQHKTFAGKKYQVYLPSAFALSIADYYIHELQSMVSGYTFSTNSHATPFVLNMDTLANHFAQVQCGTTIIDYDLLEKTLKGSSSAVDIYIIADADIFSEYDMQKAIDGLQDVMRHVGGGTDLNRVFFIEWRTGEQGYNPRKDQIIQQKGMKNTYYSKITKLEDMEQLIKTLQGKMKAGKL